MPATPITPTSSLDQPRRSFSTQATTKPSLKGHHADSSDEEDSSENRTTSTSELEEETSDTGGKDIDYAVLYDDTIEDFSFTSAREQAKKRLLHEQQQIMLQQAKEQE